MNLNFEKAFEATKKKEYITARDLYHDLLLDCKTYSDYYLLKEILFLLDQRIERHNIEHKFDLQAHIANAGYTYISNKEEIKKYKHKKDNFEVEYIILIEKGFFKSSYIGVNDTLGKMCIHFYKGKSNYDLFYIPMDLYYLLNFNYQLCAYYSGCEIVPLDQQRITPEMNQLIPMINTLIFEHHLKEEINLIDFKKIHKWYTIMDESVRCDLSRIELQDFSHFKFEEETAKEIEKTFKLVAPLMWLSDQDNMKVPVQDIKYDLLGNKWGTHLEFSEFLAVLKVLPYIEFGKSVFIHYDSYYLPYENNYYIVRSITRLENDQNID